MLGTNMGDSMEAYSVVGKLISVCKMSGFMIKVSVRLAVYLTNGHLGEVLPYKSNSHVTLSFH